MAACPHSPDNVKTVKEIGADQDRSGMYRIMYQLLTYRICSRLLIYLKGKTVHPDVSLAIAPGSKQVFNMLAD